MSVRLFGGFELLLLHSFPFCRVMSQSHNHFHYDCVYQSVLFIVHRTHKTMSPQSLLLAILAVASYSASAFVSVTPHYISRTCTSQLYMAEETKAARSVTGEELEAMLQEWDAPLVVDAWAQWYVAESLKLLLL